MERGGDFFAQNLRSEVNRVLSPMWPIKNRVFHILQKCGYTRDPYRRYEQICQRDISRYTEVFKYFHINAIELEGFDGKPFHVYKKGFEPKFAVKAKPFIALLNWARSVNSTRIPEIFETLSRTDINSTQASEIGKIRGVKEDVLLLYGLVRKNTLQKMRHADAMGVRINHIPRYLDFDFTQQKLK